MSILFKNPERESLWRQLLVGDARQDGDLLAELWHLDGSFQIGAMPRVSGRENIRAFFKQLFSMGVFTKVEHELTEVWDLDEVLIYSAVAIYTRKDGSRLRCPYTNTVKFLDGRFWDYRVYMDTGALFAGGGGAGTAI